MIVLATASVPVKLAALEIFWLLIRPEVVTVPILTKLPDASILCVPPAPPVLIPTVPSRLVPWIVELLVIAPEAIVPAILKLPVCWLVEPSKATVPLLSDKVKVRGAVGEPVAKLKLLVALPPRYRLRKGLVLEPRSMLVEPGNKAVLIATDDRLDNDVLA